VQEISLGVFVLCIFLIGFILGFFCLILLAGIRNWIYRRTKKKKKEEFKRMMDALQPEEADER